MFVPIDLFGPKEMIFSFSQKLPKTFVYTYKIVRDNFHVR